MALMINFVPDDPAAAAGSGPDLDELKQERSVSGRDFDRKRPAVKNEAEKDWKPVAGRIPTGDYVVPVADAQGDVPAKAARSGLGSGDHGVITGQSEKPFAEIPVRLQKPEAKAGAARGKTLAEPGTTARVQVKDAKAARAVGVEGVLFTAAPAASGTSDAASGAVEIEVDYRSIRDSFGGDWGSRLRLVELPACALTTPEKSECRTPTELRGSNDPEAFTVSATVDLGTAKKARGSASAPRVLAATASASGPGGNHGATSLSQSGSWMAGSSSGGFSWTYPIESQEVPGGPQPEIALSYSSQAVDGRTASTNGQSSWIAEGWDYEPGFIERR
ncbi:Rhs family-like protein, partial [Streptomyces sp. NPDC014894]